MFEEAHLIFSAFTALFQGYCLQYFYGNFLESRFSNHAWSSLSAMVSYGASRFALSQTDSPNVWGDGAAVWQMLIALGISSILAVCFYKGFHLVTVFLVVSFQAAADISRYTSVILLGELGDGMLAIWNWCTENGMPISERSLAAVKTGLMIQWICVYVMMALLLYLSVKKIVKDFHEKRSGISRTEFLFILAPAAVGLLICLFLRMIVVTMEKGVPQMLYEKYPLLTIVIPSILLLSLLSILQGVKLFQDMISWNREKQGRIILEKQVEALQAHMEEMERIYSGIRSVKHDMKNTLSVIQRLSAKGGAEENKELQTYLSELNKTFETLEVRFQTGDTIVDTLLNMKYHEAMREVPNIRIEADELLLPQDLEIRGYDIGVILGNALDNGIEACRKMKEQAQEADAFIRLSSLQRGSFLILTVENSFDGRLSKYLDSSGAGKLRRGLPETSKQDKNAHGIGLSNIKNIAEKYEGTMDFRVEGKVFILSVMMKNERRIDDGFWSDR